MELSSSPGGMDFRANIRAYFERNGLAIARRSRVKVGAAVAALCAAAAAVAAVPSASAGTSELSSSVTLAVPRKPSPSPDTVFAQPTGAAVKLFATLRPGD